MGYSGMFGAMAAIALAGAAQADVITLANSSFESGLTGWTVKVSNTTNTSYRYNTVTTATAGLPTNAITDGNSALMVWSWDNTVTLESSFSDARIMGGETYKLALNYRHATTTEGHLYVYLDWYDADKALLSSVMVIDTETAITPGRIHSNGDFSATDSVEGMVHMNAAAPASAVQYKVRIIAGKWVNASSPYYIDNITVTGNAAPVPEPAAFGVLLAGACGLLLRRR